MSSEYATVVVVVAASGYRSVLVSEYMWAYTKYFETLVRDSGKTRCELVLGSVGGAFCMSTRTDEMLRRAVWLGSARRAYRQGYEEARTRFSIFFVKLLLDALWHIFSYPIANLT